MFPYRAHPFHILIPAFVLVTGAAIAILFPSWQMTMAFVFISIICLVAGVWIGVAGVLEKYTEYWDSIDDTVKQMQKTPTELWGVMMGFTTSPAPQHVKVTQNVTGEPGESPYLAEKVFTLNLSAQQMTVLADGLLTGTKSLAESEWKNTIIGSAKIREVKHQMLHASLINLRNPNNNQSGFMLNERGVAYLYQYASDWIKVDASLEVMVSRVTTPLLEH
jgi:hypothetical protein